MQDTTAVLQYNFAVKNLTNVIGEQNLSTILMNSSWNLNFSNIIFTHLGILKVTLDVHFGAGNIF